MPAKLHVAIIIPCYDEGLTVAGVVEDFRQSVPDADIYVYDNNSSDDTAAKALTSGAMVRSVPTQGKGAVLQRAFSDVEADVYVLVDGDGTYDASVAPALIAELFSGPYDMVNASREHVSTAAYRLGHVWGNRILTSTVAYIFGRQLTDMLSGYKVLSRRFVKSIPVFSSGFEIETEMVVHALELDMAIVEVSTKYVERPEGSQSKLSTVRDGIRIASTIVGLVRSEKPLPFFTLCSSVIVALAMVLFVPVAIEFLQTGLVQRLPTAILVGLLFLLSFLSFFTGLVLDMVRKARYEQKKLMYLKLPAPELSGE